MSPGQIVKRVLEEVTCLQNNKRYGPYVCIVPRSMELDLFHSYYPSPVLNKNGEVIDVALRILMISGVKEIKIDDEFLEIHVREK